MKNLNSIHLIVHYKNSLKSKFIIIYIILLIKNKTNFFFIISYYHLNFKFVEFIKLKIKKYKKNMSDYQKNYI